ncbi:MAG: aldo/keto reductase [Actinobacteria bacterium]|nr:aldo/keto reductase [Actinomycetota bacterium]MCL5026464.1 aldo/keto reductase [Chloroflexota bacterium]
MIAVQPFGRTGHDSTRTIFGAAALGKVSQDDADRTLEVLLAYGVNHIDTAASYGDSELRVGPWMARHRRDFFLATKTGERTYQRARDQFHHSLERLRVDGVDLLQLHNLTDPAEWETAMGPGGALEAAVEAREQGLVRFIGVTGHGVRAPKMHLASLKRFDFDSVLLPFNYLMSQNPEYAADFAALLALCRERNAAVQTIKAIAIGPLGDRPRVHATWYDPLLEDADIDLAVRWVLGRPGIFLNTASDIHLLPKILEAASRFQSAPSDAEMEQMVARRGMTPLFTATSTP